MRGLLQELRQELAGLVLPSRCAGCGLPRVRGELCERCGAALAGAVPRRVWPTPVPSGLPRVYSALPYADQVREVLLAHKERGALRLAAPLGALLAATVREAAAQTPRPGGMGEGVGGGEAPLTLVPVPSSQRSIAARGHDPVRRIALVAARELRRGGVPARVLTVLRQRRTVADQAGLTAQQRAANLGGALELVPGGGRLLTGKTLLVDDVMTTGASLAEAARALGRYAGHAQRVESGRSGQSGLQVWAAAVVASRSLR
ncbi:ComF family protein [Streptomyces sp. HNM0575]|uniref:ComF family protein n=1 Tax=Streptomyces sp. HNM0575 TaxID=2716338 RepID=UPI00145E65C7|nr:ComF family protein [Streptomyces sp. HNM0575]NLU76709.1 ComF family protein [Streptomyces sp. HNM0575]